MVFVIDASKKPLDMCHPAKARRLLKDGKAKIYRKEPFTIILTKVVDKRRGYRRRRRNVNLRYRKPRFKYRTKPKGWLPPSLMSRVGNIRTFITRLVKMLPLGAISYENVKFDTQKMMNPAIMGVGYQQGTLFGYEIREYLSEKFNHRCCYCGVSEGHGRKFEVEHIIPKSRGGTNSINNLAWSCRECNQDKGRLTAIEYGHPEIQTKANISLKDSAIVNATRWKVYDLLKSFNLPVECGTGGLTCYNRTQRNISIEHYFDACCVGKSTPKVLYFCTNVVHIITAIGRGKHCRTNINASGFPRGYLARQKRFFGFQTGDTVKAVVTRGKKVGTYFGKVLCRKSGNFDIRTKAGRVQGISHKYFRLIQRSDGYSYDRKECRIHLHV